MVLDSVVVVLRVCWLCVVPRHLWMRWQGPVVVVHLMAWCVVVRRVRWVACGGRLRWGVVVMQLVGVAVVLGHRGVGVWGGGGVLVVLVVPCPLALLEWWSWHRVDVCGRWSLAWLPGCRAAGHLCTYSDVFLYIPLYFCRAARILESFVL